MIAAVVLALVGNSASNLPFEITVTLNPSDETYASERIIDIDLQNTGKKNIDLISGTITLPAWYRAGPRPYEIELRDIHGDFNAGNVISARAILEQLGRTEAARAVFTEPPLFVYKELHGTVEVRYSFQGDNTQQPPFRHEFALPAEAPLSHVLAGGIVGVLFAYLIAWLVHRLPRRHASRSFIAAAIVVPLIILLARVSTNLLPLPIAVDLRDAIGGLIVGLMSMWLVPKVVTRIIEGPGASSRQ